jgi:hypothetical protein
MPALDTGEQEALARQCRKPGDDNPARFVLELSAVGEEDA